MLKSVSDLETSRLNEPPVVRVAIALCTNAGLTSSQFMKTLSVSRETANRWLTVLEEGGLVYKSFRWNGGVGKPTVVYHPSVALKNVVERQGTEGRASLNFEILSRLCKHRLDGCCTIRLDIPRCEVSNCIFLQL